MQLAEEDKQETKGIIETVKELIPKEAGLTKAEFEGPDVVIYVKNVSAIYGNENVIRNVSTTIKKKLIVRSDTGSLMEPEKATKKILEIVLPDAGVKEEGIRYVPEFNEVQIEAMKPGLVIGKGGSTLIKIVTETGWVPKVLRIPTMNSDVIKGVRQMMIKEADFRKKFLATIGKKINQPIVKNEWIKATALGGFREVGRSSLLLETNHSKLIIDCGVSPEPAVKGLDAIVGDENKAFPYLDSANITINDLDAVILTHGHMDHIGFVPYLFKFGYEGPVYCTPPTRDLAALLLYDYTKLVQRSGGTPLYEEKDIRKMLSHMITRDYGEVTNVTDEIKLTYHNAGHILGSSLVHLHIGEGLYNVVHSGDMKFGFTRLLDQADTRYPRIDSLFLESTYGGPRDITPNRQDQEIQFMELIKHVIQNKGKVLLPVLAIGRAQEIMLVLESYMANNPNYKLEVPVYLDGMILESTAIHTAYPEYLKAGVQHRILSNNSPFESEIFEVAKGERSDIVDKGPAIILASGGMLNGGTALEYFKMLAEDERNAMIFTSYTSVNSLGRKVLNGFNEVPLPGEDGKLVPVRIKLQVSRSEGFSGHSDRRQLINFVQSLRQGQLKKVLTMHGEEAKCEDLARTLAMRFHLEGRAPMNLDSIRFK
jgi:KH/beta-lactamase-domain protein